MTKTEKIAKLNDLLRTTFMFGKVTMTRGVASLPEKHLSGLLSKVRTFKDFTLENDPYEERDFGKIEHQGESYFWKIDYYDKNLEYGSEAPECSEKTTRVLTIMGVRDY